MKDKEKQIEEMVREIARVLFEIRQDMTSVRRYIKHGFNKELSPNLSIGQYIDKLLKYRDLADKTSKNILKNLNENDKLREIEALCVKISRFGFPKDSVLLSREEFDEDYVTRQDRDYWRHKAEIYKDRLEQVQKETAKKLIDIVEVEVRSHIPDFDYYWLNCLISRLKAQFCVEIKE